MEKYYNEFIKFIQKYKLLLIVILISLVLICLSCFNKDNKLIFYDENDKIVDHKSAEVTEQELSDKYINPNDIVLELGARYGTVSCLVNRKLNNKKLHYVVEPDPRVWEALEKNKEINSSEFTILKGILGKKKYKLQGDGYGTTMIESNDSDVKSFSLPDINFNTLIVDCEGCFENFYKENKEFVNGLDKIMYETDYPDKCDYKFIQKELLQAGFKVIENINNFHYVLIK
tara:strand:- start:161 stop:850 length:690 start_codon:yes stop_codon:yes gene_type:complete